MQDSVNNWTEVDHRMDNRIAIGKVIAEEVVGMKHELQIGENCKTAEAERMREQ